VAFAVSMDLKFRPIYGTLGTCHFWSATEHIPSYVVWIL